MCEEQDVCDRAVSSLLLPSTAVAGVKPSLGGRAGGWAGGQPTLCSLPEQRGT